MLTGFDSKWVNTLFLDKIGATTVINPGALLDGNYAVMEIAENDGEWSVTDAELRKTER